MNFKDKMKLFFKNFFNENKGAFITFLLIFLLALFSQTSKASTSDLIDYSHTMSLIGDKEYCIYENTSGDIYMVIPVNDNYHLCCYRSGIIYSWNGSNNMWTWISRVNVYKLNLNTNTFEFITTYGLTTGSQPTSEYQSSFGPYKYLYSNCDIKDVGWTNGTTYLLTNPLPPPQLQLFVSTTETTDLPVLIKTQTFSQDFLNSHKCYVSYEKDSNGRTWYLADISEEGYYYINALTNGSYVFKLEDSEGNVLSTSTMTITNIIKNTEENIIYPILSVSKTDLGTVKVRTQSFNLTGIARYDCYYWLRSQQGTFETKIKLQPTIVSDDNGHSFYYCYEVSEDDTIFFTFYDKSLNKYSNNVSLTVDVDYVLNNSIYDLEITEKSLSDLLKQKFSIFYFAVDFLKEFWSVLTSDDIEPPNFSFTMPDFLGGGTFNIFNLEIYDNYKNYVHYILAGFCYFFYIKKMTKVIPNLISDISN